MTDKEFLALCEDAFEAIENAFDAMDADVETSRGGFVLEIEFEDSSKIVVNANQHLHEIWVAARTGGFHYRRDGERWVDTRTGEELFAALSRLVLEQAGLRVAFRA